MALVEFEIHTPVADVGLVANVRSCLKRGLPELPRLPPTEQGLLVIANGPTARLANLRDGRPTLAINGSLTLFLEQGIAPDYYIACDPQAHLADFLKIAPISTTYLIASKCHPSVFEALKDRHVIVWHVGEAGTIDLLHTHDPVGCAVSVTICAFEVMERLGFCSFETWGWDCSMGPNGEDHASPQAHRGTDIENDVDGVLFQTTTSWCLEAQDGFNKLRGWPIKINGGGMIGAIFEYLA